MAVAACVLCFTVCGTAQEERPQIVPGERKVSQKKDLGPRALGVLQMGANGKTSLVPIAILIDGKFWDATAYKADPVPMALDTGTVYEGERAGNSLGLFTVGSALHSNATNAPTPWLGTGVWHPVGMEEPVKASKASITPVGIDNTDGPPRLTRDPGASKPSPPANNPPNSGSAPASPTTPPASTPKSTSSGDDDDRPRLIKSTPAPDTAPPTPPATTPSQTSPGSASTTAAGSRPNDSKTDDRANIPASDSGAGEKFRPKLRRGKPAESFADDEIPGYSKPGERPSASAAAGKVVETAAAKNDVQLVPAISDASGPAPHSFAYEWIKGDEGDRRKQLMDAAKERLRAYLTAQAKARITPKPEHPLPAKRTAKLVEPIFENVQMIPYDLWNSNQAIIVFSADAHLPPPPAAAQPADVNADLHYSILLVAYPDIYNNLHTLYAGVTDKFHLDLTPRLDLVDAIDADGDGRGELLFRETSDAGTGWVVYRATADKLWKMFDSQRPE
ncbi:MAG: hypothetical protein WCB05_14050 [Candidatus Sulfotelmatobacter sp.]